MEFAVLEIGLKNKEMFNIFSFLRIQVEAFRVNWDYVCSNWNQINDDYRLLFDDWEQVFGKILIIIKATLLANNSKSDQSFGQKLAKISLQTTNSLFEILSKESTSCQNNQYLLREKNNFINKLMLKVNLIRGSIKANCHVEEKKDFSIDEKKKDNKFSEFRVWNQNDMKQNFITSIEKNCLPLAQYYINKFIKPFNWNDVNILAFECIIDFLRLSDFEKVKKILIQMGLLIEETLDVILSYTFDEKLKSFISQSILNLKPLSSKNLELYEKMCLIQDLHKNRSLSLNLNIIKKIQNHQINLLAKGLLTTNSNISSKCLQFLNSSQVCSYLIWTNDYYRLKQWIEVVYSNKSFKSQLINQFPFDLKFDQSMVDCINLSAQEYFREQLLSLLGSYGIFTSSELADVKQILRRLLRCPKKNFKTLFFPSSNHPLKSIHSLIDYDTFQVKLVDDLAKNELHHCLYSYLYKNSNFQKVLESSHLNASLKGLYSSMIYWNQDPLDDSLSLASILAASKFLYNLKSPVNLQTLFDSNLSKLAILASQIAPRGIISCLNSRKENLWYIKEESLVSALKVNYPLLYTALLNVNNASCPSEIINNDSPSLYVLLKENIKFDVSKIFGWQTTNLFRNLDNDSMLNELPHFSHPKLAGLYCLKANFTFFYYLQKGRPLEAYLKWTKSKSKDFSSDRIESACKRASVLAFYNCTNHEIKSACISFFEIFGKNSTALRLHLVVANLIMSYSAKYLSLEVKSQLFELGNLLKRAFYHEEKSAITHLMELMMIAFNHKYPNNTSLLEECFEYSVAIEFAKYHKIDLPFCFFNKCIEKGDWLLFTVFAQMYDYPKEIVCEQLKTYNGCIPDHLEKAFSYKLIPKDSQTLNSNKLSLNHSRYRLYSRIKDLKLSHSPKLPAPNHFGFVNLEDDKSNENDNLETTSLASNLMIFDSNEGMELCLKNLPQDLLSLVIYCQNNNPLEPWKPLLFSSIALKNPITSLIVASLKVTESLETPYTMFDCFCCWLYASFDLPTKSRQLSNDSSTFFWTVDQLKSLIKIAFLIPNNFIIFLQGLQIFSFDSNPIFQLVDFFVNFLIEKDYQESISKLKSFKYQFRDYREEDEEKNDNGGNNYDEKKLTNKKRKCIINEKKWIENTSLIILSSGLEATDSSFELFLLLSHLDSIKLQEIFSNKQLVPDFNKMFQLSQCILNTNVKLNISEILSNDSESETYFNSFKNIIFNLQELGFFNEAHKFAEISGVIFEQMYVNEWKLKLSRQTVSFKLWQECIAALEKASLHYETLRKFLHQYLDPCDICDVDIQLTRVFVQTKDFIYAHKLNCDALICNKLESNIWKTVIKIEQNPFTPNQILIWTEIWKIILNACEQCTYDQNLLNSGDQSKLNEDDSKTLIQIVGKILNAGKIELASKICFIFNLHCSDLEIIKFCIWLASWDTTSKSLDQYTTSLSKFKKCKELEDIYLLVNTSNLKNSNDVINILERCILLFKYGKKLCEKVILYYKISILINRSYLEIVKEKDEIGLLKLLIETSAQNPDSLILAKELIIFEKIRDEEIAQFILNEVLPSLKNSNAFDSFQECKMNASFLTLVRILNDSSILGKKFLEILKTDISPEVSVQVCIKAHECFTLSSNVEGIALVLRNARTLVTQHLAVNNDYPLMIQLLIGIGRYSEMSYIFDILRENHKFELILRKGNHKLNQLRVALLDSLKNDKEMYPLIALNFSMHREIAEIMESIALKTLKSLNFKNQQNFMSFKEDLEKVLQEFIDASESYKKADCYNKSDYCEKLAELVALQINFLPSSIIIINLPDSLVSEFLSKHSKFYEALIIAEAYQNHLQWNSALFHNVIWKNDFSYFHDYTSVFALNSANFEELITMFKIFSSSNKALPAEKLAEMKANLYKLIQTSTDIKEVYKYSQDLGLFEASINLLQDSNSVYLRDLKIQGNL